MRCITNLKYVSKQMRQKIKDKKRNYHGAVFAIFNPSFGGEVGGFSAVVSKIISSMISIWKGDHEFTFLLPSLCTHNVLMKSKQTRTFIQVISTPLQSNLCAVFYFNLILFISSIHINKNMKIYDRLPVWIKWPTHVMLLMCGHNMPTYVNNDS